MTREDELLARAKHLLDQHEAAREAAHVRPMTEQERIGWLNHRLVEMGAHGCVAGDGCYYSRDSYPEY